MIMEVPNALHVIEKQKITNLRLAGDTGFELNQGIGVRKDWPILSQILEKALADISEKEHKEIYSRWIRLETTRFYQTRIFWYWLSAVSLGILLITGSILVWNRTLKRQVMQQTEEVRFNEMRLEALLELNEKTHDSIQEIIEFAFQQMIRLTKSRFGYLAFADQNGIVYSVDSGSKHFLEEYISHHAAHGFTIETMGLWGEAVKKKKAIISNDYTGSNPEQKGLPPEFRTLSRYMNVPIFKEERVVMVAGMGNKPSDYDQSDLRQLSLLALGMWRILQRKQTEIAIYKSEKNMRDLVENSPNGIVIMQHGKAVYRNSKQLELIGEIKPMETIGYDHIYSEDVEKVRLFYQGVIQENPTITELDFRFYSSLKKRTKETMKWVTCIVTPIDYKDDKAFLLTTIDRTRARELEHLLTVQDKMASLGHVATGIGHEIRNPLSGINIYLRTLEKSIDNPEKTHKIKPAIEAIRSASGKMESVIKRVMDFSRPTEPRFALIDIHLPVLEAIHLAGMGLDKRQNPITVELDRTLPPVYAEPHLIEEVILNLINNAVDAMADQKEHKRIRISSTSAADKIILMVEDTGPGVPGDLGEKIFEPFFTTKSYSTGIGLSLCHRIITDHAGTITVEKGDLGGAKFVIALPFYQAKTLTPS
jgi:PAS domain S-box-containing protein